MIHSINPKLLERKVEVVVVGAGGTGSQVIPGLVSLHMAMVALGHPGGLDVTVVDDDAVSQANVGRQNFFPSDVGRHKATVLVNRVNMLYGLGWKAKVARLGKDTGSKYSTDIVIGCVDNREARANIVKNFRDCYYLDFGNRKNDGQCILGELNTLGTKKRKDQLPHAGDLFPEIMDPSREEDDDTPSCSLAEALQKQSLFVNRLVASWGLNLLSELFCSGQISHHGVFVNLKTGRSNPLPVDPEAWKRFGYKAQAPRSKKK